MIHYLISKQKLFTRIGLKNAVINIDSSYATDFLIATCASIVHTYGFNKNYSKNHIGVKILKVYCDGFSVLIQDISFRLYLLGRFNLSNMLGSIACLLTIGISLDRIVKVSRSILLPNGRMQRMIGKKVWIDFSHTPDALKEAICALKLHYLKHNIIVVFGCGGGNRDKVKRAKMGQVADRFANHIILTNDNSRSEPSKEIIKDIKSGIYYHKPQIIPNRNQAITKAILNLKQNDCLLIAGKGHEQFQIIDNQKIPQNDSQIASDVIRKFC